MKLDLPTPEQILEELVDKTVVQIDRRAPVAFEAAYDELTRYHRFLLGLNAATMPSGEAFSYAEISDSDYGAPHRDWIGQYRRLFERAADRIPEDGQFIELLAGTPVRLLSRPGDSALTPTIIRSILDLQTLLVGRLEAWVTKRTLQAGGPARTLPGSDTQAYRRVLSSLVGTWETLLYLPPKVFGWPKEHRTPMDVAWSAYGAAWPFLWQHLSNTAYCLALAVWNHDEIGAIVFKDALLRWMTSLDHHLGAGAELQRPRALFPSVLERDWSDVARDVKPLTFEHMPPPTASAIFSSVVRGAFQDVILLTALLLLRWTLADKQDTDLGARMASSLLRRETGEELGFASRPPPPLTFRKTLFDVLRLGDDAGERWAREGYGAHLDALLRTLDQMTERDVVPGRVYTPTTLNDRSELIISVVTLLAAIAPESGDDGLDERLLDLMAREEAMAAGDVRLRGLVSEFERMRGALKADEQIARGIAFLSPDVQPEAAAARLDEILTAAIATVEARRRERLEASAVDPAEIERLRSEVEAALLAPPFPAPLFRDVAVAPSDDEDAPVVRVGLDGVLKAQLVEPPMIDRSRNFDEVLLSGIRESVGRQALRAFTGRPREAVEIAARPAEPAFWREVGDLVLQAGPEPVLLVSKHATPILRQRLYNPRAGDGLKVEHRARPASMVTTDLSYVCTINEVDVYGGPLGESVCWLVSSRLLLEVTLGRLEGARHVRMTFEPGEEFRGGLVTFYRPIYRWADSPIFELRLKLPEPLRVPENDSGPLPG